MYLIVRDDGYIGRAIKASSVKRIGEGYRFSNGASTSGIKSNYSLVQVPDQDLNKDDEGVITDKYPDDISTQIDGPFFDPGPTQWANVSAIDATRSDKKYVQVKRVIQGQELTAWCYVAYSVLQAYQAGDLAIDDYVVVEFAEDDLSKPIVMDKVVGL